MGPAPRVCLPSARLRSLGYSWDSLPNPCFVTKVLTHIPHHAFWPPVGRSVCWASPTDRKWRKTQGFGSIWPNTPDNRQTVSESTRPFRGLFSWRVNDRGTFTINIDGGSPKIFQHASRFE